ncbi:chemotaxis protein CheD [Geovibrio thiophilus]|nr:chemotaxis protein CheD [Geovibrio thiophilus]
MYLDKEPAVVSTVLGSCVSVVMFWSAVRIGGMCHAMLPSANFCVVGEGASYTNKFVDASISYMHSRFYAWGAFPSDIEVKVFGGADMFRTESGTMKRETIGAKNIQAAFTKLASLGYRITAQDVGGDMGRKLYFYSSEGRVFMKNLRNTVNAG